MLSETLPLLGKTVFMGQALFSRSAWAAGCSALLWLDKELACTLISVVPKENRRS